MMKNLLRRALTLAIALTLVIPAAIPSAQAAFSDVTDPVVLEAVEFLCNMGVISSSDSYKPNEQLDRASYCKFAVEISGVKDLDRFRDFTIFPDVRANHWALPYINAAVRELKIISGKPDGTFRPGDPISYNEAATLLVRMLGYTEAELGFSWPRNYVNKAASLGLTKGITAGGNVTRGQAAVLFYNLMFTKTRGEDGNEGGLYIDKMKTLASPVEVVIADVNGLSADGKNRGLVTIGGEGFYLLRTPMNQTLVGSKGELIADSDGYLVRFTASKQTSRSITYKSSNAGSITGTDGLVTNVPPSATVYDNGTPLKYSGVWQQLRRGDTIRVFFTSSGAVDYVIWGHDSEGGLVYTTEVGGAKAIYNAYGISDSSVTVVKNGAVTTADAIAPYDTMSYVPGSGRVSVSSLRVSAPYSGGTPAGAPESITIMGRECKLSEKAQAQAASSFRAGSWVTACLASDGTVGALYATSRLTSNAVGWATSDTSVRMMNGLVFSGGGENKRVYKGMLVTASGVDSGMTMARINVNGGGSQSYDVKAGTIGKNKLAEWCAIYTMSGDMAYPIEKEDIPDAVVPGGKIKHIAVDANGRVELLVLDNINGDALRYGFLSVDETLGLSGPATLRSGSDSTQVYTGSQFINTEFVGLMGFSLYERDSRLYVGEVKKTVSYEVTVNDFSGFESVVVDGQRIPIADNCMLRQRSGQYLPLGELPEHGPDFEIFCDSPAGDGGKVRMILTK